MLSSSSLLRAVIAASLISLPAPANVCAAGAPPVVQGGDVIGPRATAVPDPEGEALVVEFGSMLKEWNERRVRLSRGGKTPDPKELGPHPALAFRARFDALLAKDSGWAQCWWLDNLQHLTPDSDLPGRKRVFVELYDKLLARNASQQYMMFVLGAVKVHRSTLGADETDAMLDRLVQASTNHEVQARAAYMRAAFHAPADPKADPARMEEAVEMHRGVVANWPSTVAAKESAGVVLPGLQREFERREAAWLERCFELQRQGADPKTWPAQPVHELHPLIQPLAGVGLPGAVRWVNRVHNGYVNLEPQGPAAALTQLASALGSTYPVPDSDVVGLRLGLCELILRQFPDDPATERLIDDLLKDFPAVPPSVAEARLAPLFESSDSHRKAIGFHFMVRSCSAVGRWPGYVAALEWSERMARECPGDPLLQRTQKACATVRSLMPGEPAPEIAAEDLERKWFKLSDYKGRVVMLLFCNLFLDQGFDEAAKWQEFATKNASRPFSIVAMNAGSASPDAFFGKYAKLGVSWRTGLLFAASEDVLRRYMVASYPTIVVIDAEGKLRGRDLSWDETKALLEQWIADAEAKGKK
ncbi:MAG: TlpA family protein disulfide reductase [Planctomycetes bacterium]|nr:TlpA family protein disulfide reductase [Planctomycetota bacterium]